MDQCTSQDTMGITTKVWANRLAERTDLSTNVVHLTCGTTQRDKIDVLLDILEQKTIRGSTTERGFIVGSTPAVCFQDAPLHALVQNLWYEKKYRDANENAKWRYASAGVLFRKTFVYRKGGRPVIYDKTSEAKKYLPKGQWWRIVNYDLDDDKNIIDWTHEREWRVPGDFTFEWSDCHVMISGHSDYQDFLTKCKTRSLDQLPTSIQGLVSLTPVLY